MLGSIVSIIKCMSFWTSFSASSVGSSGSHRMYSAGDATVKATVVRLINHLSRSSRPAGDVTSLSPSLLIHRPPTLAAGSSTSRYRLGPSPPSPGAFASMARPFILIGGSAFDNSALPVLASHLVMELSLNRSKSHLLLQWTLHLLHPVRWIKPCPCSYLLEYPDFFSLVFERLDLIFSSNLNSWGTLCLIRPLIWPQNRKRQYVKPISKITAVIGLAVGGLDYASICWLHLLCSVGVCYLKICLVLVGLGFDQMLE